jgi:hypothetical protein
MRRRTSPPDCNRARRLTFTSTRTFASTLALALLLVGCAFRPGGTAHDDDGDDDDVITDAAVDRGDDPVPDARTIDAAIDARAPFELDGCPDGYRGILNTSSRWRMIDATSWSSAAAACRGHLAGATHLAVFAGQGDRDAVGAALFFSGEYRRTWIGVWNDGQAVRTVTGEPVYPSTTLASMQAVTWVRDLVSPFRADPMTASFAALCECDGLPSAP